MHKLPPLMALFLALACNLPIAGRTVLPPSPSQPISLPARDTPPLTPIAIPPVPSSVVQIQGAPYRAYQASGDPFRFVCPDPCAVDPELIFAQYSGFHSAYEILLHGTGVDALPELTPVDFHLTNDKKCGTLKDSPALSYAGRNSGSNAYICTFLFEYARGFNGQPYSPEIAVRLDLQTIFIHEYLHTIFYGRITRDAGAIHDFVTPLAMFYTGKLQGGAELCAYHPQTPPGDYGGYLIQQLCTQNGFRPEQLAPSLIALDEIYRSDGGKLEEGYQHKVPTTLQFREILNRVLGGDTAQAFADACWPAKLFGDSYVLPYACTHRTPTVKPSPVP